MASRTVTNMQDVLPTIRLALALSRHAPASRPNRAHSSRTVLARILNIAAGTPLSDTSATITAARPSFRGTTS